ncbi:hypothetical protein CC1G_03189 [Coprinopsis cinerea okayama7|uniref:BAG domain-containing protein n=1 Tax=Coprinopsis cinerea (strain Okayama-7 / 130 / ATCC MYA-4618 / FGSC 9003) TaxID=240176 RepID=A8N746_COPC7|nr:hypothetical protein CC1G_03189 [Coprinopsis cinerea okayama7\|eukprot:XP_001830652.1 hypothetical protein CC1G_03189 [Coprinopsis cinerea okayama7\
MSVTVKFGRDRISLALPSPDTTLHAIKQSLADYTGLNAFKLIHKGAVMRDDNAPISAYRIHPGSVIQMIPVDESMPQPPPSNRQSATTDDDENSVITTIHTELAMVRSTLAPDLNDLLGRITNTEKTSEKDKKEFLRIGELLLQSLLRLDGVTPDRDWVKAREERKKAVKEVQGLLDTLDDTVAERRAAGLHN